jgi:hypothetical protein
MAGTTDWVQFGVSGSSSGFSLTNEKGGGSVSGYDTVGAVSLSDDTYTNAGVQTSSPQYVSYTNGTSPASSATTIGGTAAGEYSIQTKYSINNSEPATGATLSFTIDFNNALSSGNIYVIGNSYAVPEALFTAALSNGNTVTATEGYGSSNQNDIFDIGLSNITAGSSLNISWAVESMSGSGNPAYGNVSLNGVALALVPEPSTYAMLLGGLALLGFFVRRRTVLLS